MSKENGRRHVLERYRSATREKEKPIHSLLSRHLKKVYPIGLHKSSSLLSLSSLSLCSSHNSSDSLSSSTSTLDQKISLALRLIAPPERRQASVINKVQQRILNYSGEGPQGLRRCNWVTKSSDIVYVQFHDECWGVPVYDEKEAFAGFDLNTVAKMEEKEIMEIASNKAIMLAESRVRCIVDIAKCILKAIGSFSGYMWGYVDYKPIINRHRYPRNVPLRAPKAEAISKDLLKRGFRLVGPVIVYSFMQAAGMTIDHLVDCFRFSECVSLAERPWRHV
ncbi:hypothetical protein RJ639_027088 [Escallonia herrerae]|uniref:DNA-3-methyladenine glycosylase I n=1 Tax=Escallonia herrerae TaxID=1293975 RepID=A0AA88XCI6_9ASTE|nr:hypothetical protein RJ639_027088 [Escallonia herrerae]